MTLTASQKDAIEKIRKVLAHVTGNANEHEADNAATRVLKLLAIHNLTMEDVNKGPSGDITTNEETVMSGDQWRAFLAASTARLYFCEHHIEHVYPDVPGSAAEITFDHLLRMLKPDHRHFFHGREHNVVVAKEMFAYFCATVERLAARAREERGSKSHALDDIVAQEREKRRARKFELAFQYGCAKRIAIRLDEKWFDMTRSPETQAIAGNKLPAIYKQNDLDVAEYVNKKYGNALTLHESDVKPSDFAGMFAGFVAGKNVGLDTQVAETKPKGLK